jgi:cation diffusion facilitator CzcD-associated flavoprotein CzcO
VSDSNDVAVVGAGPAGLATSYALSALRVPHIVFERGAHVGYTWANLYDSLVLHTARGLSHLPGLPFPAGTPQFPSRGDLLAYLRRYADVFTLPIAVDCTVVRARPDGAEWILEISGGTGGGRQIRSRALVVATGVVANPVVPEIPNRVAFRGRVLHSVDYRRPDPFLGRRVLIVGAGNSAGEIAAELAQADVAVTVAARSGANTVPRDIAGVPIQYLAVAIAALPRRAQVAAAAAVGRIAAAVRGPSPIPRARPAECRNIPLVGFHLVDAIVSGRAKLRGGIGAFTEQGMRFADGDVEPFDDVILATGFRSAVGFLGDAIRVDACGFGHRRDGVASADHPNLFFVGHNYDARGGLFNIARDAGRAARRINAALCDRGRTSTGTPPPPNETRSESSRRASAGRDAAPSR